MIYPFGAVMFGGNIVISDADRLRIRGLRLGLLGRFQMYSHEDILVINGASDFFYYQNHAL